MGRGDRRHSLKSLRRKSQRKLKDRIRKAATERAARLSAVERPEKKPARAARKPAPSAS